VSIELDSLSTQINAFLGLDTTGGVVLTPAAENPTIVSPSKALVIGTGLALGLLAGVLGAFLVNALRRRVRDDYDVRRAGGGEVLGEITSRRSSVPAGGADLDTIRTVRELLFATMPADSPVVAVADISKGQTLPDVAVNLAHSVAETGRSVDLVVADASQDTLDTIIGALELAPEQGSAGARRFCGEVAGGRLSLIAPSAGTVGLNGASAGSHTPGSSMTVIAVPQNAAHSSLLAAGRLGHTVVLVASKGTSQDKVKETTHDLAVVGATVSGTVLVSRRRRSSRTSRS
jgi:non-specific protein-tyrosine kinase